MNEKKVSQINIKAKTDLIKKVSRLRLTKKHEKLFQKIMEKGTKNWSDIDIEFLMMLVDIHYIPILNAGGICLVPWEQQKEVLRETERKRESALNRMSTEPFSLWIKDVRNYKKTQLS